MPIQNKQLSAHFSLKEMTKTTHGHIDNWPTDESIVANLALLCQRALEPIRIHVRRPMVMHSGYRCEALNRVIGGSMKSQHMKGQAADFHVPGLSNYELAKWIDENVNFDQLILENFLRRRSSAT